MSKSFGLKIIPPKFRLIIVVVLTSLFAFIYNVELAGTALLFSTLVLIIGRKLVFKKAFFFVLIVNTIYMFLGNWLFSPKSSDSISFFVFRINNLGIENGIIGALKRNAMIIFSFAWLSSVDSLYEVFQALDYSPRIRKTLVVFFKWIQNLSRDFTLLYYSMQLREYKLKTKSIRNRITQLKVILKAVINKFFFDVGTITFSGESHFNYANDSNSDNNGKIEIEKLTISYEPEDEPILQNIDLSISKGEVVLVTGENNSGKSTLLKVISGYIPKIEGYIVTGKVATAGFDLNSAISLKEISQYVRYLIENPGDSIIGLNVKQELLSQTKSIEKIEYYSNLLKIKHLWDRDTNTLSGGEQVKVILASLLCSNIEVLILESPLNQLDPKGRETFVSALQELIKNNGVTVVISDTYFEYFKDIFTRIIVLQDGKISKDVDIQKNGQSSDFKLVNNVVPKIKFLNLEINKNGVAVQFNNVSLNYGKKSVLSNLNLSIFENDCIAIMGDNGSGKSSAMLLLSNVLNSTSGTIDRFNNKVGMVFQDCTKQIIELTIIKEVGLLYNNVNRNNSSKDNSFINNQLQWLNLPSNKQTIDLSASDKRLLEVASNIYERDVVIFDEPSNHLSPASIVKLQELIQSLINQGKTVLIVTHDEYLANICNRFLLLHDSKLVLDTNNIDELKNYRINILNE